MTEKTKDVDVAAEHELAVKEATAEPLARVKANEKMHADAEKLGAAEKPHVQEPPTTVGVVQSDRPATEGATVAVQVGYDPEHPNQIGQEELGMEPMEVSRGKGKKGAPIQPPGRGTTVHTKSATTDESGRPLVFFTPTGGTLGTVKTSGGSVVTTGGVGSGSHGAGVVYSDLPAGGLGALPTFSDRVVTDSDITHPTGGVTATGQVNGPRLEAPVKSDEPHPGVVLVGADRPRYPELVESDRRLEPGAPPVVQATPESGNRDRPHTGGGEALGMGPTHYKGYGEAAEAMPVTNETKKTKRAAGESKKTAATDSQKSGQKADELDTKVLVVKDSPQTPEHPEEVAPAGMEIETKDVKQNPSTEQKDRPVETGTKAPDPTPKEGS